MELPKHSRILRACLPQPLVSKLSESSPCAFTVMDFGSSQFPGAMYQPHDQTRPPPKPNQPLRPAISRSSVRSSTFPLFHVVVRLPIRVDFRSRLSSTCHTEPNQQLRSACRQVRQVSQKLSARVVCRVCLVMADVCLPIWLQLGWALRRKRCCVICVSVGGHADPHGSLDRQSGRVLRVPSPRHVQHSGQMRSAAADNAFLVGLPFPAAFSWYRSGLVR